MDDNTAVVILVIAVLAYWAFKAWVNRTKGGDQ